MKVKNIVKKYKFIRYKVYPDARLARNIIVIAVFLKGFTIRPKVLKNLDKSLVM